MTNHTAHNDESHDSGGSLVCSSSVSIIKDLSGFTMPAAWKDAGRKGRRTTQKFAAEATVCSILPKASQNPVPLHEMHLDRDVVYPELTCNV